MAVIFCNLNKPYLSIQCPNPAGGNRTLALSKGHLSPPHPIPNIQTPFIICCQILFRVLNNQGLVGSTPGRLSVIVMAGFGTIKVENYNSLYDAFRSFLMVKK
jgi:hypothetical protein